MLCLGGKAVRRMGKMKLWRERMKYGNGEHCWRKGREESAK